MKHKMKNHSVSMIRYSVLFLLCFCSMLGHAQENTVEKTAKFFVGFNLVSLTSIDARTSLVVGGKGGLYIGEKLFLGGRAAGIVLNERYFSNVEEPEFGYIGPMLGYHVWRKNQLQASVLAASGLAVIDYATNGKSVRDRALFILPSAELEYFFSKNIAIAAELGYRNIQKVDNNFTDAQLTGMEFGIGLKLGRRP